MIKAKNIKIKRELLLDDPKDAKFFLRGLRYFNNNKPLEYLYSKGKRIVIDELTDEEYVKCAIAIYTKYFDGQIIELDSEGDLQ